ncbi:MAG TPA: GIY-YIG nuclease family protein [Cyclobacteriaceae bacterium]
MTAFFILWKTSFTQLNSWAIPMKEFVVYIIYSEKLNRFYVGTSDNFLERLSQHNSGHFSDSFSVKGIPWTSFLVIEKLTSEQAFKIEKHIKSMKSSVYIHNLKAYPEMVEKLMARFE